MKNIVVLCLLAAVAVVACDTGDPTSPSLPPVTNVTEEPKPSEPPLPTVTQQDAGVEDADAGLTDAVADVDTTPKNQTECIAVCEKTHATGAALAAEIDKCWTEKCNPACTHGTPDGTLHTPAAGDCVEPVKTPFQACSDCTVANCCAAWDGVFGHADGKALNVCVVACYSAFPQ